MKRILLLTFLLFPVVMKAQVQTPPPFSGDSMLFVLVDFADRGFHFSTQNITDMLTTSGGWQGTGSVEEYWRSQSGGQFQPGIRVVGPYHLSQPASVYNGDNNMDNLVWSLYDSAALEVDMSHFRMTPNGGSVCMILIYAGSTANMQASNPYINMGRSWTVTDQDGVVVSAASEMNIIGDTVIGKANVVGCMMNLLEMPYPYATMNYTTMGASMPANLSMFDKAGMGWATIDTLQGTSDSVELKVITGTADKGYYVRLSNDEFLLIEARALSGYDSHLANDGMWVYHGSEQAIQQALSAWESVNESPVIGYTALTIVPSDNWVASNYLMDFIPFAAHNYSDTTIVEIDADHYLYVDGHYMWGNSLSPMSHVKPMLFDSTVVDSVWITNIRWKNDTVMLFDFNSNTLSVEAVFLDQSQVSVNGFAAQGRILNRTAVVPSAKGVVYSSTLDSCTLEQGVVVYDTSSSVFDIVVNVAGLAANTSHYYRTFATVGTVTVYSDAQQVHTKGIGPAHIYYASNLNQYVYDIMLSDDVDHYYFFENMTDYHLSVGADWFTTLNDEVNRWDVYDVSGPMVGGCHVDSTLGRGSFGLWIFTTSGDTIPYLYSFDLNEADTVEILSGGWLQASLHREMKDDVYSIHLQLANNYNTQTQHAYVGVVPGAAMQQAVEYYLDTLSHGIISNNGVERRDLSSARNYSLFNHLVNNYSFVEYSGRSYTLPQVNPSSDSTVVLILQDEYGVVQIFEDVVFVGTPSAYLSGVPQLGGDYDEYLIGDSTVMELYPNSFAHHYYMILGTTGELANMGVVDNASALSYILSLQSTLTLHEFPGIVVGQVNPSVSSNMANNIVLHTLTDLLPDTDYYVYLLPYNASNISGAVEVVHYQTLSKIVDILPAGNGDTAWWYMVGGEPVWRWEYVQSSFYFAECQAGIYPSGTIDSICAAGGLSYSQLLPQMIAAGRTRNYGGWLPYMPLTSDYSRRGDTITGLIPDTEYEICLWFRTYDGDTLFQRAEFSTAGLPQMGAARVNWLELGESGYGTNWTMLYYLHFNDETAYAHIFFGEVGQLASMGITSPATARQYSSEHNATLPHYTYQYSETYFKSGETHYFYENGHNNYYVYNDHPLSPDSVYAVYVVPYTANGEQGFCRYITFVSPYSANATSWISGANLPAADITSTSARLHGIVRNDGKMAVLNKAFDLFNVETNTHIHIELPESEDTLVSYIATGLLPNTTYGYSVQYGAYYTGAYNHPYGSGYSYFTTASCTTDVTIDTTICYNSYYNGTQYTSSHVLHYTYPAVGACDTVVTVNLNVLPQRIGYDTVVLCYGEEYEGVARYNSTTLTFTITEENQCDSTLKMRLNVLPRRIGHDTVILCYGDEYDGIRRYASTTLYQTIEEEGQCDSTIALYLKVLPQITSTITDTLHGNSYLWIDTLITEVGTYQRVFTSAQGCDSTVTLHLVAEYNNGIDDIVEQKVLIYQSNGCLTVEGADGYMVTLYDATGRTLAIKQSSNQTITFDIPASGTYLVKIGDAPARRIVVVR